MTEKHEVQHMIESLQDSLVDMEYEARTQETPEFLEVLGEAVEHVHTAINKLRRAKSLLGH